MAGTGPAALPAAQVPVPGRALPAVAAHHVGQAGAPPGLIVTGLVLPCPQGIAGASWNAEGLGWSRYKRAQSTRPAFRRTSQPPKGALPSLPSHPSSRDLHLALTAPPNAAAGIGARGASAPPAQGTQPCPDPQLPCAAPLSAQHHLLPAPSSGGTRIQLHPPNPTCPVLFAKLTPETTPRLNKELLETFTKQALGLKTPNQSWAGPGSLLGPRRGHSGGRGNVPGVLTAAPSGVGTGQLGKARLAEVAAVPLHIVLADTAPCHRVTGRAGHGAIRVTLTG